MARSRSTATTQGFRPLGALFGLLTAALGGGLGWILGEFLSRTTRLDWYVNPEIERLPAGDVGLYAAALAAVLVLVFSPLCFTTAFAEWRRRLRKGAAPAAAPGARSWDVAQVRAVPGLTAALAAIAGVGLYAVLVLGGIRTVAGSGLPLLLATAGGFAGFFAGYAPWAIAARGLAAGTIVEPRPDENLFAKVALLSSRQAKPVLAAVLALAVVGGYGASLIDTNVDVADVLPRGDPNTAAAKNLTTDFKSTFTQQVTFQFRIADLNDPEQRANWEHDLALLPNRVTETDAGNISDEVYIRAMDQAIDYIKSRHPEYPFTGSVAAPDFYRLINWTLAGGTNAEASAYALPGTDRRGSMEYASVHEGVWTAIPSTIDAVISPSFRQTSVLMNVDPKSEFSSKEIGQAALDVRRDYVEWAESTPEAYKVFTGNNTPKFTVDLPLANAHSSELAAKDFKFLIPVISVYIMICLAVAFRSWSAILISFSSLAIAVLWTFGAMGFMRIPLNTLNMTTVALIMGVGIDYGIHVMNEYQEHRAKGSSIPDAFRRTGARGFIALFVATLTTVAGLIVMVVSPSLLIAQLGILSAIAMASCFLLTVTFVPAALTLAGDSAKVRDYKPSPVMGHIARVVGSNRVVVVVVVLVLTIGSYGATAALTKEEFGDPPRNWLPEDKLRQEHEEALKGFYDSETDDIKVNIIIFEGDIADPQAHAYMDAIEASLLTKDRVISDTLRTLPFLMRTWLTVRDGAPGAGQYLGLTGLHDRGAPVEDTYPQTREEIEALMEEAHASPLRSFSNLFYNHPDNDMAMMLFSAKAASYEEAEEVWNQVWAAINENEDMRPEGLQVAFFGNTAINYLFIAKELPWLTYMSVTTNILVALFVFVATRSWRAVVVVAALNFVTSLWWLALLPALDIGLAITLTLPLVFIYAIGSDYGLHLALAAERTRDPEETFRTTGKAVLMSAVTTLGSFLIYTQISNLSVRKTMVATALAIGVIFVTTMLIVPLLYPPRKKQVPVAQTAPAPESEEHAVTIAR